ncbi:MAG: iron-siderophore ABC transporter substrate-binding protein, partial [Thermomicrobiales bacterium]|nr:iron-siderophore ABC transporter substrate-binding protein [Thermomicrobiales bacterium]
AEIYGMTHRSDVQEKLQQAIDLTVKTQNAQGSWRYRPYAPDSDMSIAVCQLMALRAARNIGLQVPKSTIDRAYDYISKSAYRSGRHKGAFKYQIDQSQTRVSFALGAAGLAAGFPWSTTAQDTATPATGRDTRRIEHKYGVTELAGDPQRVVTIGYTDQDPVLALGVKPVAVREWFDQRPYATWPWAQDELGSAQPEVLPWAEFDFEQIANVRPDLIISAYAGLTAEEYATLSRIAPTVAQSGDYPDYGTPWQVMTRTIGQALGREEQAEELIAETESLFAQAREEHPEFAGATGIVADAGFETGNYGVYTPTEPRGRFLSSLGFAYPPQFAEIVPPDDYFTHVSRERFTLLNDVDVVVWLINGGELPGLLADPVFQQLDVVKADAIVYLDNGEQPYNAALSFSTVLSLPYALEGVVPMLAAAIAGRSATSATPAA